MSKGKGSKQSRMSRMAKAPIRILCKARDLYVQTLTSCAGNMRHGGNYDTNGLPAAPKSSSNFPRSFSVTSSRSSAASDEDFRQLMRVASLKALHNKYGTQSPQQQWGRSQSVGASAPKGKGTLMPRSVSHSVAIARIDEDKPCDFAEEEEEEEEDDTANQLNPTKLSHPFPRSE
ncbi:uncharacterized protein LOC122072854 [Macadamia integrifolia]|uniref:uncharacterized protein LOC122072854 n=1 Tax=Macadamia integrifolia TaxID=60698 RepID=UPI001C4F7127|nr:uncharacterized protein LOC122072854 [Macadamia integrifolia]